MTALQVILINSTVGTITAALSPPPVSGSKMGRSGVSGRTN